MINMLEPFSAYVLPKMIAPNYEDIFGSIESYVSGLESSIQTAKPNGIEAKPLEEMKRIFETAVQNGYAGKDGAEVAETLLG